MKELIIAGRCVRVDLAPIARGLYEIHEQDENTLTILRFGMLQHNIMESAERSLLEGVKGSFDTDTAAIFNSRIKKFVSECMHEISVLIYKQTEMVV